MNNSNVQRSVLYGSECEKDLPDKTADRGASG
jgi:hypothetical protein